ncbi:MAG: P-II family nitrogen regulator [Bdellovibrionales bacterium]
MKEVKAIVQPFVLNNILEGLSEIGKLPGLTVSQVQSYSIEDLEMDPVLKIKLEIMVPADLVERVVTVIQRTAHTGNAGDGRIFVIPIEETIKIRTGERGTAD